VRVQNEKEKKGGRARELKKGWGSIQFSLKQADLSAQRRYSHFWSKEQNELSEGEVELTDC